MKVVTNKDFSTLGSCYEEWARLVASGGPLVEGRAAIQTAQQRIIDAGVQALHLDVGDVIEAGDSVIEIDRITLTIKPPGGVHNGAASPRLFGAGGKMARSRSTADTFNSDQAAA